MSESFVLDASALLCLLKGKQGFERVLAALPRASISAVNLSEVYAKLAEVGGSEARIVQAIEGLHLRIVPFDAAQACSASMLHPITQNLELSLGDRACLALARQHGAIALTTDPAWTELSETLNVTVELIA
ncbi:type II toxin-antitoxin system VapC family toxin [Methylorubrum populi]|jgi:ribonuclease VapC|uniref:Type II toxin-antitoxin system VapC family toxin n=1 Tax=Methylobacterium ajmalii TaxID=2738439 RepID=A0ABV0A2V3_9HYPH|nr:type II toxin-antitoxin system VapC family toxin [Methylobacterium sp.]MBX9933432.1 type II toxin-antitoxin system VapC family toxin [Methylobacterium sp.]